MGVQASNPKPTLDKAAGSIRLSNTKENEHPIFTFSQVPPARCARASVATHTKLRRHPSAPLPPRALSRPSSKCHRSAKHPAAPLAPDRKLKSDAHICRRCRGVSPAWLSVARSRISVLAAKVSRHSGCVLRSTLSASAASTRAWSNPRSAYFDRCTARNHQHLRWSLTRELRNRLGQHPPQPARRRVQPVVFERVDRLPHSPLVQTKRRRPPERWRRLPAGAAEICMKRPTGAMQRVAATSADTTTLDRKFSPAGIANWNGSKPRQRRAA